jgi:hypothetical protein
MFGITPFAGAPFGATGEATITPVLPVASWGYETWGFGPWGGPLDVTVAITGVSASGAVGAVVNSSTIALTGATASGLVGSLGSSRTVAVSGVAAEGVAGTVSDQGIGVDITGNAATGTVGTVTLSGIDNVTVSTTACKTTSLIIPIHLTNPILEHMGIVSVNNITNGSFNIVSNNPSDNSICQWFVVNPV